MPIGDIRDFAVPLRLDFPGREPDLDFGIRSVRLSPSVTTISGSAFEAIVARLKGLNSVPPVVDTAATAHRDVKKVSPKTVADATLDALSARRPMALVGDTRILPALLRLAPETAKRMVSKT